mmetsp:Transcript_26463/g.58272  ORF Transcript_26463/g.58272 Transcript_26463/m.58272 type:complete len:83 (-) Transcript_26463:577-825(-)
MHTYMNLHKILPVRIDDETTKPPSPVLSGNSIELGLREVENLHIITFMTSLIGLHSKYQFDRMRRSEKRACENTAHEINIDL